MAREGMNVKQFNEFMKRCGQSYHVRYISPTIHARVGLITAITIFTSYGKVEFTITNNPDENFNLNEAVNKYLDELSDNEPIGTVFV